MAIKYNKINWMHSIFNVNYVMFHGVFLVVFYASFMAIMTHTENLYRSLSRR